MADDEMFVRWAKVRADEWLALNRVAVQAREAVQVAADAGVHLGPLRAALDPTPYRVEGDRGWRPAEAAQLAPPTRED